MTVTAPTMIAWEKRFSFGSANSNT